MDNSIVCLTKHAWRGTVWWLVTVWSTESTSAAGTSVAESAPLFADEASLSLSCGTFSGRPSVGSAFSLTENEAIVGLSVTATDCKDVWQGNMDKEYVEKNLKPDGFSVDQYLRQTKHVVVDSIADDGSGMDCDISLMNEGKNAVLSWKLPIGENDDDGQSDSLDDGFVADGRKNSMMRISGSLKLNRIEIPPTEEHGALFHVLEIAGKRISELEQQKIITLRDGEKRNAENVRMKAAMDKLVSFKEKLEHDMYAKFCVVLNEKKRKIRELNQQISVLRADLEAQKLACDNIAKTRCVPHSSEGSNKSSSVTVNGDDPGHNEDSDAEYTAQYATGGGFVDYDDDDDVVFAGDDDPGKGAKSTQQDEKSKRVKQPLDLLGLQQSSGDLSHHVSAVSSSTTSSSSSTVKAKAHKRHHVDEPEVPKLTAPSTSPIRSRQSTPQRKRGRRSADHDGELDPDALFNHLD